VLSQKVNANTTNVLNSLSPMQHKKIYEILFPLPISIELEGILSDLKTIGYEIISSG
jgi:hypothetical protein